MTTVFGDFLIPAGEHISAATLITENLTGPVTCGVIREVGRIVTTMARYTGDFSLPGEFDAATTAHLGPQTQAALDVRLTLRRGAQAMRHTIRSLNDAATDETHPAVRRLTAAATHLATGRDLLQTHFATSPYRERQPLSYWAPVITSTPLTAALLDALAGQALRLAPWAAHVSLAHTMDNGVPTPALLALNTASRCLWVAGATIEAAHRHQPPPAEARTLLTVIPANAAPPRLAPTGEETVPALRDGLITTAERLRYLIPVFARRSRWSPAATSESWRKHALASAITGHTSEIILRTLAGRATQLGLSPTIHTRLLSAADAMQRSWVASRALAHAWDTLSTGTSRHPRPTPLAAELGDLVLRTGRLAYTNPQWTPASGTPSPRDPTGLAAAPQDITITVTALHHTADALSLTAAGDHKAVQTAADDSRLHIATRLLPDDYDIPHRYSPAPISHIRALLSSYDNVNTAYRELLKTMSGLAKSCPTQSTPPGAVRSAATHTVIGKPSPTAGHDQWYVRNTTSPDAAPDRTRAATPGPGHRPLT